MVLEYHWGPRLVALRVEIDVLGGPLKLCGNFVL